MKIRSRSFGKNQENKHKQKFKSNQKHVRSVIEQLAVYKRTCLFILWTEKRISFLSFIPDSNTYHKAPANNAKA